MDRWDGMDGFIDWMFLIAHFSSFSNSYNIFRISVRFCKHVRINEWNR